MAIGIWVNIGSGNGLLPDSPKPLHEPMLTDHQWNPVTFMLGQFHKRCINHQSLTSIWKSCLKFHSNLLGGQWVKCFLQIWISIYDVTKWLPRFHVMWFALRTERFGICAVPTHYLNQCWLIIAEWILLYKLQWNLNQNTKFFIQYDAFENNICKM